MYYAQAHFKCDSVKLNRSFCICKCGCAFIFLFGRYGSRRYDYNMLIVCVVGQGRSHFDTMFTTRWATIDFLQFHSIVCVYASLCYYFFSRKINTLNLIKFLFECCPVSLSIYLLFSLPNRINSHYSLTSQLK